MCYELWTPFVFMCVMATKRSICVYHCDVWGSSNFSYLKKAIIIWGGGLNQIVLCFTKVEGLHFMWEMCLPIFMHLSVCKKAYWPTLVASALKHAILFQREHKAMDGGRENARQRADSSLCLGAVCGTRPSAHSLSQQWFHYCSVATRTCSAWPLLFLSSV